MMNAMKPNERLRRERDLRGWSLARVAQQIGTTARNVSRWEHGMTFPSPHFRERLCMLYGKDTGALGLIPEQEHASPPPQMPSSPALLPASNDATDPPLMSLQTLPLIGRDALLEQLKASLFRGEHVALHGLPGVGKTALAAALALEPEVQAHFPDGVLWADLGPHADLLGQLRYWGTLVGVPEREISQDHQLEGWSNALRRALAHKHVLLVINDVWHIRDVQPFLVQGPACGRVITTRLPQIALSLATQGVFQVPELNQEESVNLLHQLAPDVVTYHANAVHTLGHAVGGLPLALTILGKHLRAQAYSKQPRRVHLALQQLEAAEIRLCLVEPSAQVDRPSWWPLHASLTLQSMITLSEEQLSASTRNALAALSILPTKPESFSEAAALAVTGAPPDSLDALYDAGLLESDGPGRYMLHPVLADYGDLQLAETLPPLLRLIEYGTALAQEQQRDEQALEQESSCILAALDAAYRLGLTKEFVRGTCAFVPFLLAQGHCSLAGLLLQRAYEAVCALDDLHTHTEILFQLTRLAYEQQDALRAETRCQEEGDLSHAIAQQALRKLVALATEREDHERCS